MKNYKRLTAITMAGTMLLGSGLTASAAGPSGGDTGSGSYEGYVDETSVFSASIPTNAANLFNFFVDPNGLLEETGYARLTGKSADDFESGATLFFTRTGAEKEFGKDSDKVTAKNMSSYDVNIEVSAAITGIDGITMSDSDTIAPEEQNPTLYLAIVHDSDEEAVKAEEGGLLSGTIAGTPGNFEIQYNAGKGKYEYAQRAGVEDSTWATYDFYLTGACGGVWTDAQAEATPEVALTWKITDPNAKEAPSIANSVYEYVAGQAISVSVDLGVGELAATGISSVTFNNNGSQTVLPTSRWSFSNGKLIFNAEYIGLLNGISRTHTITFNDAAKTTADITLEPWKADVAPSIAKTTYEYVAGQDVVIPVDLGRGTLVATGVASVTFNNSGSQTTLPTTRWSYSNGKVTFLGEYCTLLAGASREHTITFNDEAQTTVNVTLQPAN